MPKFPIVVNTWEQLTMFGPLAVELNIRVGIVAESDHCQVQVEWWDPSDGTLLGMQSQPHFHIEGLPEVLRLYTVIARQVMEKYAQPF